MSNAHPEPYKIEHGPDVPKQIQAIKLIAEQAGKYQQFVETMEESLRRLQADPHGWADPLYHSKHVDAIACRGLIRPLVFHYVIYEEAHGVVLLSVRLYATFA